MTPSDDTLPPTDPGVVLQTQIAAAERRWRREWLTRSLGRLGIGLAVAFLLWAMLTLVLPTTAREWPAGVLVALGALVLVIAESRLREPDWPRIRRRVDQQLGLPDAVLTASELRDHRADATGTAAAWISRQLEQTAGHLRMVDWRKAWPINVSMLSRASYTVTLAAILFVGWRFIALRESERPPPPTAREIDTAKALRETFDDWDKSQQQQPDPELKKLLDELKPLREKLAAKDAGLNEREAFTELSRVEDKLAAMQAKLDAQSLQPMAADMAAALDKVDSLGALASAVRRNDFDKAEAAADKAAEQMNKPGAKMPQGAQASDAAGKFGKLAQQFGKNGNAAAEQAMSQMQSAVQQNQSQSMSEGLKGLKQCLGSQNARDGQKRNLALQCKQMGMCKGGLSDKESLCKGMSLIPKLSMVKSEKRGHGAGSEIDPNRNGAPTDLAGDRNHQNLSGVANEQGETETNNLSTLDPTGERTGARGAANFTAYEKLSQQAVADENLPLAHRQTIKRYFESIRPAQHDPQ